MQINNKRIDYLINKFKIVDSTLDYSDLDIFTNITGGDSDEVYFIINKLTNDIIISRPVLDLLVSADPTIKKVYSQWIMNCLNKILRVHFTNDLTVYNLERNLFNTKGALTFLNEDLPQVFKYLTIFDQLKKTKIFREQSKSNMSIIDLKDATDINQYHSIHTVYDAIFPYIPKNYGEFFLKLQTYSVGKEAEIVFEDKTFMVYIPFSRRANEVLNEFASWCTTQSGNTQFTRYTKDYKRPDGAHSKLYVVINKNNYNMFQLHFETDQINNNSNRFDEQNFIKNFLNISIGLNNFFYNELLSLSRFIKGNKYAKRAISLGYGKILIDMHDIDAKTITIRNMKLTPDLSLKRFDQLKMVVLIETQLNEFPNDVLNVSNLEVLSLPKNNISFIPEDISKLKKLRLINLVGNRLTVLPESIKYLDPSNGGSLLRLSLSKNLFTPLYIEKLKELIPNVDLE